jgi:hypothetical protein
MKKLAVFILILVSYVTLIAQTEIKSRLTDEEISDLTSKLAMKLLLNDSQKSAVSELLKTYGSELQKITAGSGEIRYKDKQELVSSINSQVEALLDSKQKMKYDVLKKDWWSSINSEESN